MATHHDPLEASENTDACMNQDSKFFTTCDLEIPPLRIHLFSESRDVDKNICPNHLMCVFFKRIFQVQLKDGG